MDMLVTIVVGLLGIGLGIMLGYSWCSTDLALLSQDYNALREKHSALRQALRKARRAYSFRRKDGRFIKIEDLTND